MFIEFLVTVEFQMLNMLCFGFVAAGCDICTASCDGS